MYAHVLPAMDDLADSRVLEAAAEDRADRIVSGDRNLLRLGSWRQLLVPVKPLRRIP